jgi:electron transfer flavoprotein alpha subunit
MARVLLVAHDLGECEILAAFGQKYGEDYDLLCLIGQPPADLGASRAISTAFQDPPTADVLANGIAALAEDYSLIAGVASMFGKDWLPRCAALMDRPMVSDIIEIHGQRSFTRPMFAGNVMARVEVDAPTFVASIRGTAFAKAERRGASSLESLSIAAATPLAKRVGVSESKGGRPDLTQARVVVSGGRPLKDAATFEQLIGGLADKLGGAAGATRAAVDTGIAPNDTQVGQTGKIVAPELYIAAGVSGSTQHIAGMKDSKVIVAINTDKEAPIFEIADYGLVQDLFTAIPEIMQKLGA